MNIAQNQAAEYGVHMIKIIRHEDAKPGDFFLIVEQGGSGWMAVMMWINDTNEDGLEPFPEPYQTGIGRYRTREEAQAEMRRWAESDDIPVLDYCAQ